MTSPGIALDLFLPCGEGGERKESPPATSLVAVGLFDRWGGEKRMRKVHAPCQLEGERAQFKFANVSAAAPRRLSARPQMARVDTHKICSVGCRARHQLSLLDRSAPALRGQQRACGRAGKEWERGLRPSISNRLHGVAAGRNLHHAGVGSTDLVETILVPGFSN